MSESVSQSLPSQFDCPPLPKRNGYVKSAAMIIMFNQELLTACKKLKATVTFHLHPLMA